MPRLPHHSLLFLAIIAASFAILHSLNPSFSTASSNLTKLLLPSKRQALRTMSAQTSAPQVSRKLARAPVLAVETQEGVGATVRRSIGTQSLRNLTPFLMLDHFKVVKGAGFPDHPHRGQTTVTMMLKGYFQHEDSKGHKGIIGPGDMQWMQAAGGIVHAEMPLHEPGMPDPEGLQLWLDLPAKSKLDPPTYTELTAEQIPSVHPSEHVTVRVIAGQMQGNEEEGLVRSVVAPAGGAEYYHAKMSKSGATLWQPIPAGWSAFVYSISGSIYLGPSGGMISPIKAFHTSILTSAANQTGILIEAASNDVEFVLIAGEPLDQPVVQYGPFVMTSEEEIHQAFDDFRTGKNGFLGAKDWKSDIGGRKLKA